LLSQRQSLGSIQTVLNPGDIGVIVKGLTEYDALATELSEGVSGNAELPGPSLP
jgi:hypothetical protein